MANSDIRVARLRVVGIYFDLQDFIVPDPDDAQAVTIKTVLDAVKENKIIRLNNITKGDYARFDYGNETDERGLTFFEVEDPKPANENKPTPDPGIYRIEDNVKIPPPQESSSRQSTLIWQWYRFSPNPTKGKLGLPDSQDGVFNGINSGAAVVQNHESIIIRPVAIILPRNQATEPV